ncbi:hypothetical protein Plhal710r2_c034g0125061 [Plasmopara halstedii]
MCYSWLGFEAKMVIDILDRHVFSLCSNLKLRLQHNELGFRYKFRWRTEVISSNTCACRVAIHQWKVFLRPFDKFNIGAFDSSMIVFPHSIRLQHTTIQHYRAYAFCASITIVRCCGFRAVWLHRNKRVYNIDVSTSRDLVCQHAFAYIKLHFTQFQSRAT